MVHMLQQVSSLLLAILLGIGIAHSESAPNKPYKVCPTITQSKDYPCVAIGPTATITQRDIIVPDTKIEESKVKVMLAERDAEIEALKEEIRILDQILRDLADREMKRRHSNIVPSQKDSN